MDDREQGFYRFCWGGLLYGLIEIFWRGNTHWTMLVTGGACFWLLDRLDRLDEGEWEAVKCLKGALLITAAELSVGLLFNRLLGYTIWDYSALPYNFWGQVCPLYTIYWYFLCYPAFWLLRRTRGSGSIGISHKIPRAKGIANGRQTVYNRDKKSVKTPVREFPPGPKENA